MKADQYIIAIKRSFILLLVLSLSVLYVSYKEYSRQSYEQLAELLGTTFALLQLAPTFSSLPDSPKSKLSIIYYNEWFKYLKVELEHSGKVAQAFKEGKPIPPVPDELRDPPVAGVKLISPIVTQIQQADCAAAIYSGPRYPWPIVANVGTDDPTPFGQFVLMSDIFLANLSWKCMPYRFGFNTLLIIKPSETVPGNWLVGVPSNIYRYLDAVIPIQAFTPFLSTRINSVLFIAGVPKPMWGLVFMSDEYAIFSSTVLKRLIINFAKVVSGKTFRDVDTAMTAITDFNESTISVTGLPIRAADVIELSPLVALFILYLIYQRVYVLTKVGYTSDVPWLFKDVLRKFDLCIAYVAAVVPLFCIVIINFLYADLHAVGLYIPFNGTWEIRSALRLERWLFPDYGKMAPGVNLFSAIVLIVFLISLFFGVRVMFFLFKISSQNRTLLKGE